MSDREKPDDLAASAERFDVIVIGGGPAGQKAAIQAKKAGKKVFLVDEAEGVGGECVRRGTIPSKTLRETAMAIRSFPERTGGSFPLTIEPGLELESLLRRMETVVDAHMKLAAEQLGRNGVEVSRGRAKFVATKVIEVRTPNAGPLLVTAEIIVLAAGSRPRAPEAIAVDHEFILDSDSILSLTHLPASLTVLGAGVIATEYASIFSALGTRVTMIDRGTRPVSFLDPELTGAFLDEFERQDGRFIGGASGYEVRSDGIDGVVVRLASGEEIRSERMLVTLGRVANVKGLALEVAGVVLDSRGLVPVDEHCETCVPGIYGVGDIVGPPALASSAMEQARRAMRHALRLSHENTFEVMTMAVYAIPETSSVGLSEEQARAKYGSAITGRANFREIARGHIAATRGGFLKLVADAEGKVIVGAQIVGESAAELIHVAQMAILGKQSVEVFTDNVFNFPTLAEAYRVAALDLIARRTCVEALDDLSLSAE